MKATILNHPDVIVEEYKDKVLATYKYAEGSVKKDEGKRRFWKGSVGIRGRDFLNLGEDAICRQVKWTPEYVVWEFKEIVDANNSTS